jgi:uncharacterized protein YndB with AHSA1/START domain
MEAKDSSMGFDFEGIYNEVKLYRLIAYTLADDRKVKTQFNDKAGKTYVKCSFEAESMNSNELQKAGWQSILDNFKKYAKEI